MVVEFLFILMLIVLNGVLAMAEMSIVSARRARLQSRAEQGQAGAEVALQLTEDPSRFLSTVQVGITLIGVLVGALGGAALSGPVAAWIAQVPTLAPYSASIALALVVIVITYVSLVIGEVVPKRMALSRPEAFASALARPLRGLSVLLAPFVHLLSSSSDLLLTVLGLRRQQEPTVTEEEVRLMIEEGTHAGIFEETEQEMIEAVFRLGDRAVGSLLTPRTSMVWLDLEQPLEESLRRMLSTPYSRFPVCRGSIDQVVGVLQMRDLLAQTLHGEPIHLEHALQQPFFVYEGTRVVDLLERFRREGLQMAIVIDEYTTVQGLVTLTDVLEAIVGEVSPDDVQAVQRDDGSWLLDGLMPIEEVTDLLDLPELPDEERGAFHTLGGFILTHFGVIPHAGDHFEWRGLRFEVVDMDGKRVDKVLVSTVAPADRTHPASTPAGDGSSPTPRP